MNIKKVLVSQPKPSSDKSPFYTIAENHKIDVVFRPFIKVEGLTAKEFRQSKINLADFTAVILSSKTAVDNFFRLCEESRVHIPDTFKYFCTTEAVALYLQKYIVYRKRKIFFGKTGKLDDPQLLAAMTKHKKEKMIFPVSEAFNDDTSVFDKNGYDYKMATMFRTVSNDFTEDEPFDYDVLLFFSPIGIASLKKNFPDFDQKKQQIAIGCYGSQTIQAAKDAGLTIDIEAPSPKFTSITAALDDFITRNEKAEKKSK